MIKWVGAVLAGLLISGVLVTGWIAVQSVEAGTSFLRTGRFTLLSKTEPLKIVTISCQNCAQSTIGNRFTSKAEDLDAVYRAEQKGILYLRFASGRATIKGKSLKPGCHEIALDTADQVAVSAKRVDIVFPQPERTCPVTAETSEFRA